jgi:CPA1 family monovalent cation:H+ antiporter
MFETVAILLVLGSIFGYLNYRLFQLPFAIAMMIAGLMASMAVLGADAMFTDWHLGQELRRLTLEDVNFSEALMRGMLSFLLFAGALHTDMTVMNKFKWPIISLASVGVCISTAMIGFGTYGILGMLGQDVPMIWCLVFGALISPTDPVAVLGIMKAAGAPKPVEIQVVGESLFNDGVGVVIFTVLLSIAMGGAHGSAEMDAVGIAMLVSKEVIGGILLGLGAGWILSGAQRPRRAKP